MKKYVFVLTSLTLSAATVLPINVATTVELNHKNQDFNLDKKWKAQPTNAVENWYKFLATNDWKVFITRDTWVNKILSWAGDALMGLMSNSELHDKIYNEYKSWPSSGNRNFDNWEYSVLVNYTYGHLADISKLVFSNSAINRIVFKTDSDKTWVGVYDASV